MTGAIHADLLGVRAEVMALADCLERLVPCRGIDRDTPRGLSLMVWHIAKDIDNVLQEIETLDSEPQGHSRG
ncbi:MAG: hypothetical protein LBG07_06465 [Treponema sp.]|jgi:hypothetical protein|nr:hypothetical protein [Treponema sp.]